MNRLSAATDARDACAGADVVIEAVPEDMAIKIEVDVFSGRRNPSIELKNQEARDFTLTESSEGKKNWTLWASYAAMYNVPSLVDASTVRIEFFDSKGDRFSTLLADRGVYERETAASCDRAARFVAGPAEDFSVGEEKDVTQHPAFRQLPLD